eukprot:11210083-Lingulodinium_polyedra.AAC.1
MRQPPRGGWRMKCGNWGSRGIAVMKCVFERISEHVSRETCSEMRPRVHSMAAVPRKHQFARFMRRPPHGGWR